MELEKALQAKEKGNQYFRNKAFREAIQCYTQAIDICPAKEPDRAVFFKNRAACWLKLEEHEKALSDCLSALQLSPGDVKTIYREAQALEGLDRLTEALVETKKLLSIDPRNREANEMAMRLTAKLMKDSDRMHSTDGLVDEMFAALGKDKLPAKRRIQAAKNLAILSREEAGAEKLFQADGIAKLQPSLDSSIMEVVNHVLQTYVGLCNGSKIRAYATLKTLSLEKLSMLMTSANSSVATSSVVIFKEIILAISGEDKRLPCDEGTSVTAAVPSVVVPILQLLFLSLASHTVSPHTRDCVLELLVKTVSRREVATIYLRENVIEHCLLLAADTAQYADDDESVRLPVSDDCRVNVSMMLSTLYTNICVKKDQKDEDHSAKKLFKGQCASFVLSRLQRGDLHGRISGLTGLAAILQGVVEVGNEIFAQEVVLKKAVEMAESENTYSQLSAAEALALAASDKSRCQGIMSQGLPALKTLYHCKDDRIKVRALVGLCKLGASHGGNVNERPFAEGATVKLEKSCRRFLITARQGDSLRKWAAEGIAFLCLDAEVKEALINDEAALKVLFRMTESPDKSLVYGIASIFVNLSNSYDKVERNAELEELGKFAGENIPKEHEWDGEKFVKKRVEVLLKMSVVTALISLSKGQSQAIHEQVSRVFLALVTDAANRGTVIQQGGVKCLLFLTSDNTDKGKLIAAQALAKIGITNDPRLAFAGQRSLEVARPFVQLLKSEVGLQQFEGLMALTNLAGMGEDAQRRILREGALPLIESLMFEEHDLIRRAATEAMCNMISLEEVHQRFYGDDLERVKLLTLFSGEEDEGLAKAASGGLSQLTHDPKICEQMVGVKHCHQILKELLSHNSKELQLRSMYILANLVGSSKEIATKIIEDDFLELFQAFLQGDFTPEVKAQAERALQNAAEHGLIMPNPEISR